MVWVGFFFSCQFLLLALLPNLIYVCRKAVGSGVERTHFAVQKLLDPVPGIFSERLQSSSGCERHQLYCLLLVPLWDFGLAFQAVMVHHHVFQSRGQSHVSILPAEDFCMAEKFAASQSKRFYKIHAFPNLKESGSL